MTTSAHIQRLGKDTILYGVGMALQHFGGFLLFPMYARVLSKSDVGTQDLLMITVSIAVAVLSLGMDAAAGRFYFDAKTPSEQQAVMSSWFVFTILTAVPVTALIIALAEPISQALFQDRGMAGLLRLAVAALPFKLLAQCFTLDLRLTFRARQFSLVTGAGAVGHVVGAIVFLFWLRMGLTGVFLGILAGTLCQMGAAIALSWRHFRLELSTQWLWPMVGYGVQLVPVSVSVWLLNSSNRYFLLESASLDEIALLGAATKIVAMVTFLVTAFQISWGPFSYSLMHLHQQASETYARALTYFLLVTITASGLMCVFAREALRVLATPAYETAAGLVPWLCFASICAGSGYIVGTGASIAKKSYHTTIATVLGAGVNLGFNLVLIPKYGVMGASMATAAGALVLVSWRYYAGQKYFMVDYPLVRLAGLVTLAGVISLAAAEIDSLFPVWSPALLVWKTSLSVIFLGGIGLLRLVERKEFAAVLSSLRKKPA